MSHRFKLRICTLLVIATCSCASLAQRLSQLTTPTPVAPGSTLVIGFLGGYDRWNDEHRSVRRLVIALRRRPGLYAESISNHRRGLAVEFIRQALDSNRNKRLDPEEIANAQVILLGQSWGGAAAIDTARDLEKLGIPLLLTVQVDSVGIHDDVIPPNVLAAVNFFQHDPFTTIHGRRNIRAADPAKTIILGNFEMSYTSRKVDLSNASIRRRIFGGSHTKMELDPLVWKGVEQYISDAIARRLP
jgi:pimeloyl-ACP methyl ester carboxylesterase